MVRFFRHGIDSWKRLAERSRAKKDCVDHGGDAGTASSLTGTGWGPIGEENEK